jgi:ribA/ribD-fused uncharacterized protein
MANIEQFRDPQLDISGDVIGFYPRESYVFNNFSSFQVEWRNQLWQTSEHAYQASRFTETAPELSIQIRLARSAHLAFKLAQANKHRQIENWDDIKEDTMLDICRHKLMQYDYIQKKLLQTGDIQIVEDSPVDSYWGWGPDRQGRNALGKI